DRAGDARLSRVQGAGYRVAVGIELRPDARDLGDRARIQARGRIDGSRQTVHQRLVEHVVGHLPGRIPGAAGVVEQRDVEASETRLLGRDYVDSAPAVVLAVQREVVLEHEHGQFRGRVWIGLS